MKIQPIRGTHDLFGNEIKKYNQIKEEVNSIANNFNFSELQTPIFESSNLLNFDANYLPLIRFLTQL